MTAIPTVPPPTRAQFEQEYLAPARPVVIKAGLGGGLARWTPESLAERLGDKPVSASISQSGVFHYDPVAVRKFRVVRRTFRQAVAEIGSGTHGAMYLMQQSIHENFPELAGDVRPPELLGDAPAAPHFWFGSADNVTPLHHDPLTNLFLQVYGRKRFTLFDARQFEELYPFPASAHHSHLSYVDIENPDLERFPLFAAAHRYEATLGPGDLLFLPAFWWHHVRSLDVSISLNFWSAPALKDCLTPAGLRLLMTVYERDRLATMGAPFRAADGGFLESACEVFRLGRRWPAVLLASAAGGDLAGGELRAHFERGRLADDSLFTDAEVNMILAETARLLGVDYTPISSHRAVIGR